MSLRIKIKNIPLVKQMQSILLKKWVNNSEFIAKISVGPAKGLMFPVQMPQDKLMWLGTWEIDFATEMNRKIKKGWICYDIGGYKGYYAGIMALAGAKKVYVFEPMPSNIENIEKLIKLNPDLPIQLKKYAVSDFSGIASFNIMPEETMGKLNKSSFQSEEINVGTLEVDTVNLDDFIKQGNSEPDFIKIDVEGAEEFVLIGALDLIKRKQPMLMIEVHSPVIGKRCLETIEHFYSKVFVLETGNHPIESAPDICHYIFSK